MNWCPRSDSNRQALRRRIFFPLRLSPPSCARAGRLWSGARLHPSLSAVGARRLLSTPSPGSFAPGAWLGISSDGRPGPSPSLTGFTSRVSPGGLKLGLSPLRLPIPPLGRDAIVPPCWLRCTWRRPASSSPEATVRFLGRASMLHASRPDMASRLRNPDALPVPACVFGSGASAGSVILAWRRMITTPDRYRDRHDCNRPEHAYCRFLL